MGKKVEWLEATGRTLDPVFVAALVAATGNKFFSVGYYAKDGELRETSRARLNVTSRMADNGERGTNEASDKARATLAAHDLIPFVDLTVEEGRGWRSFRLDRVAYFRGLGESHIA